MGSSTVKYTVLNIVKFSLCSYTLTTTVTDDANQVITDTITLLVNSSGGEVVEAEVEILLQRDM